MATFESPIGHSVDGYVIRHTVSWCPEFSDGQRIQIDERVVNGKDGTMIGRPRVTDYRLLGTEPPIVEPVTAESGVGP